MSTLFIILHAWIVGWMEILPFGAQFHRECLALFTGTALPSPLVLSALSASLFCTLVVIYFHDLLSIFSGTLRVLIFRRKPATIDERMPLFLLIATGVAWAQFHFASNAEDLLAQLLPIDLQEPRLRLLAMSLAFGLPGLLFLRGERLNRRSLGLYDTHSGDAASVSVAYSVEQLLSLGRSTVGWAYMLGRTYQREAALKWLLLMGLPFLFFRTSALWEGIRFQGSGPEEGLSWISFGVGCVVTSVTAAIGVHGWKKSIHQFSFKKLGIYRIIMMILTPLAAWLMSL